MNRLTLRQLWNQRRANGWLLAELVVVSYFLWGVIDPVYVILSNRAIPDGYELADTYLLQLNRYHSMHRLFQTGAATDSALQADFMQIVERVEHYPGVSAAAVVFNGSYPQSGSWMDTGYAHDTLNVNAQVLSFLSGTDFFGVFRMKNAEGNVIPILPPSTSAAYGTTNVMRKLFPNGTGKGNWIHTEDTLTRRQVADVLPVIQTRSMMQPRPLIVEATNQLYVDQHPEICFRVRDGLASQAFTEQLKNDLQVLCRSGNFYFSSVNDFPTLAKETEIIFGTTGTLQLQLCMASFFMLCTFLGMVGTFWFRCQARRNEIGLRMAMGSSRQAMHRQFLFESWVLTTLGFVIGLLIVFQRIWHNGFAEATYNGSSEYLQNRPVPHFLLVTTFVYLLLVAVALIGTWIPAERAARTQPADALRDE